MTVLAGYAWATLAVRDLDSSVAWYRRVFGLDVLMTNADTCAVGDTDRFVYLIEPSTFVVIGLHEAAAGRGRFCGDRAGLADLALDVGPGKLRAWLTRLDELGVAFRGPTPWSAGTVVHMQDPDGIPLLLFEPSAG